MTAQNTKATAPLSPAQKILTALKEQNPQVAELAEFLQKHSAMDLSSWLTAAMQEDPQAEQLCTQITESLKAIQRQIEALLHNPQQNEQALGLMLELIKDIAEISPSFKTRVQEFYTIKISELKSNRVKQLQLKQNVELVLQTENLKQVHLDLINTIRAALREVDHSLQEHVAGLKTSIGKESSALKAAREEFFNTTKSAIESANSNAPFDKLRKIGWMLATMVQYMYVAPLEAAYSADVQFKHENPETDPFMELQKAKHHGADGDVIDVGGGAPVISLPPGLKPF